MLAVCKYRFLPSKVSVLETQGERVTEPMTLKECEETLELLWNRFLNDKDCLNDELRKYGREIVWDELNPVIVKIDKNRKSFYG